MQVVFLGGASAIGASCLAIETNGQWLVVDAGVRVGSDARDPLPDLSYLRDKEVRAVLVTHAHADHIGALPLLHAAFPSTPIYCTRATGLLLEIMLGDALRIMSRRATEELEIPLYRDEQVAVTLEWLRPLPIDRPITIPDIADLTITATLAGHVAGAACFSLEAPDGRLVISGDISVTAQRTVPGATIPPLHRPDLLIMESTYGRSALHANRQSEELRLAESVATVIAGGGHCLIPAFALGRAQEVLLILNAAQGAQQIPRFPIYVDGLVRRVTNAYMNLPEALNPRLTRAIQRGRLPFGGPTLNYVRDAHQREAILAGPPACIVASSGMLTGGPSAWFAERLVANDKAAILITGYQDEESAGRKLLALADTPGGSLTFGDQTLTVRCSVQKYNLSAHADASELVSFAAALQPAAVALVHGDGEARTALAAQLTQTTIHLPTEGQSIDVQAARRQRTGSRHPESTSELLPEGIGADHPPTTADLVEMYALLRDHEPERISVTTRELAHLWYPTPTEDDEQVIAELVATDPHRFIPILDLPGVYRLIGAAGVSEGPGADLVGQLLLVRFGTNHLAPALCLDVTPTGLEIITPRGAKGFRRIMPADVLEVLGTHLRDIPLDTAPDVLKELDKQAQSWRKRVTRADLIAVMDAGQSYSLDELTMLVGTLREDVSQRLAVAHMLNDTTGIVRSAASWGEWGGPARYSRDPEYLAPVATPSAPSVTASSRNANTAALNAAIDALFGGADDLYRRGFDPATGAITLYFFFPSHAERQYAAEIAQLAAHTDVPVSISPNAHQGALAAAVRDLLPDDLQLTQAPSVRFDEHTVLAHVKGTATEAAMVATQDAFYAATDWHLHLAVAGVTSPPPQPQRRTRTPSPPIAITPLAPVASAGATQPATGNDLVALSRKFLPDTLGVVRRYLKPTGELVVVAEFPEAARQQWVHRLEQLREVSGASVEVGGTTSNLKLTQAARLAAPLSVRVAKSISVYPAQKRVLLRYEGEAPDAAWEAARARFYAQTGWELTEERIAVAVIASSIDGSTTFDQATAMAYVRSGIGPELGLIKVSGDLATTTLTLRFQFPDIVRDQIQPLITEMEAATGWAMMVHPQAHPLALEAAARALVPAGTGTVVKKIALDPDRRLATLTYHGFLAEHLIEDAQRIFITQTGWHIVLVATSLP